MFFFGLFCYFEKIGFFFRVYNVCFGIGFKYLVYMFVFVIVCEFFEGKNYSCFLYFFYLLVDVFDRYLMNVC